MDRKVKNEKLLPHQIKRRKIRQQREEAAKRRKLESLQQATRKKEVAESKKRSVFGHLIMAVAAVLGLVLSVVFAVVKFVVRAVWTVFNFMFCGVGPEGQGGILYGLTHSSDNDGDGGDGGE